MTRPRSSRPLTVALAALLAGAGAWCTAARAAPGPEWAKGAYARVDGVAILRTAIDAEVAKGWPKDRALQQAITKVVLERNLLREGFDPAAVTADELKAMVKETRERMKASGMKLEQVLARSGQTLRQFKDSLRIPVCLRKLIRSKLTEERLRELYERQALALRGEVRASHILIKVTKARPAPAARAKAAKLLESLGADVTPAKFAEVAQRESEDPLAPLTGGDLDWFRARASREVPPAVVRAAFTRGKQGLVGEPVRGRLGFHVVLVTGTRMPKGVTFARLKDELRQKAESIAAARTIRAWVQAAKIEYAPDAPRPRGSGG